MNDEERDEAMQMGPLEYAVIGVPGEQLHEALRSEINSLGEDRGVQLVDLVVVTKDSEGRATIREVRDLDDELRASFGDITEELLGLLSTEDIAELTVDVPPATSAIVVLFEHTWARSLTDALRDAGGVALAGGMVAHEAAARVIAELELEAQNG